MSEELEQSPKKREFLQTRSTKEHYQKSPYVILSYSQDNGQGCLCGEHQLYNLLLL